MLSLGLKAQISKEQLIKASLEEHRNPIVLDSLANGLMAFEDDSIALARAWFLKGLARTYASDPGGAANNFQLALALMEVGAKYDERFTYEMVLKNYGIANYRSRNYQKGDSAFHALKDLALATGDSLQYSIALKAIANAFMVQGKFDTAAQLMEDVALVQQSFEYPGLASTYLSLGSIYGRIQLEEEALKWFRKALNLSEGLPDERTKGRIMNNMAVAHRASENYDSANYYLYQALKIQRGLGSAIDQVEVHANLARNYVKLQAWDSVQTHLNNASKLLPPGQAGGRSRHNVLLLNLQVSNHLGDAKQALLYFDSLRTQVPSNQWRKDPEYLRAFANFYELNGQKDSAISYLKQVQEIEDRRSQQKNAGRIKQASNKVEIAALKKKNEGELRGYQLAILSMISFLLLGGAWFWFARRKVKKIKAESSMNTDESVTGLDNESKLGNAAVEPSDLPLSFRLKSKAVINVKDLIYLQSDGHYVNLYLKDRNNPEVERSSLKNWEEKLEAHDFIRIHRSYLVKGKELKAVYASKVLLEDGTELPVSRTYKDELKNRFNEES